MKEIVLQFEERTEKSTVLCGEGVFEQEFPKLIARYPQSFIFTDETVYRLYGKEIDRLSGGTPVYAMPAGEEHKTQATLFRLLGGMIGAGLHRNSCLFAIGGGVVGDIGGLAAALYMRGIDCVQVPTTLLSQVDSSVGGKTAIDYGNYKNMIGAFKQPLTVLADGRFLHTLPERELRCGLGEIVKHGALNAGIFDTLWKNRDNLYDLSFLSSIVPANVAHKAHVVLEDEKEAGLRKSLNLGHTTGHAIELNHKVLSHGEYVLVGMRYEAELAKKHCQCDKTYLDMLDELIGCALGNIPMPSVKGALEAARLDKKNESNDAITITVPVAKGKFEILTLPYGEYEAELLRAEEVLC